jgi:hypothetical protein
MKQAVRVRISCELRVELYACMRDVLTSSGSISCFFSVQINLQLSVQRVVMIHPCGKPQMLLFEFLFFFFLCTLVVFMDPMFDVIIIFFGELLHP